MINHAKFFWKSCLMFCETSLLVKFSRIGFKYSENNAISCLNRLENVLGCFYCDCSMSVFTAYLHANRGEVSPLAR